MCEMSLSRNVLKKEKRCLQLMFTCHYAHIGMQIISKAQAQPQCCFFLRVTANVNMSENKIAGIGEHTSHCFIKMWHTYYILRKKPVSHSKCRKKRASITSEINTWTTPISVLLCTATRASKIDYHWRLWLCFASLQQGTKQCCSSGQV